MTVLPSTAQSTRLLPRMEPTMMKLKATVHIVLVISPSTSLRDVSFTGERSDLDLLLMREEIKLSSNIPIILCRSETGRRKISFFYYLLLY